MMRQEEAEYAPNMVTGTFSIKTCLVEVLFDFDATHSFNSTKLVEALRLAPTTKLSLLPIALSDRKTLRCEEFFVDSPIQIDSHEF